MPRIFHFHDPEGPAMLKYFFILFALLVILVVSMAGFRGQKS